MDTDVKRVTLYPVAGYSSAVQILAPNWYPISSEYFTARTSSRKIHIWNAVIVMFHSANISLRRRRRWGSKRRWIYCHIPSAPGCAPYKKHWLTATSSFIARSHDPDSSPLSGVSCSSQPTSQRRQHFHQHAISDCSSRISPVEHKCEI